MAGSTTPATDALTAPARTQEQRERRRMLFGVGLVLPALLVSLLFSLLPIAYLVLVSLTERSTFFFTPSYTLDNYALVLSRYLPNVWTTVYLAALSSLIDLVLGYPFAYILVRKVRYRELVRALMIFPLFGPLYLSFGMYYLLLPTGPLGRLLELIGVQGVTLLYSLPSVLFGMALFTFPFMVMNVGAALSNVDPLLEEAAICLGASQWQTFTRVLLPLSGSGILAGLLMCFGWNLGVHAVPLVLGTINEQRVLSIVLYQRGVVQFDYGMAAAMGVALMALAFSVTWVSLRFSRGALAAN
jgi:putative spermidine/putrescine transport system permease protein